MSIRFITGDDKGSLLVRRVSNNEKVSLPHLLKVELQRTEQQRDYFRALEGTYMGVDFSVAQQPTTPGRGCAPPVAGGSYLSAEGSHLGAGTIRFDRRANQLWYDGTGPVAAITDSRNPIPLGTFALEIPDHPHELGEPYLNQTKYALVWFRVLPGGANTSTDRYLHTGADSAGCVTVQEVTQWTAIYNYLINRRKDDVAVGTIVVTE
jgi:hypothetical protein